LLRGENIPVKLVIVGGRTGTSDPTNATFADEIDQKIAALSLSNAVHWTGFVDDSDVSAYLHAADAVTLPFLDGASYRRGTLMAAIHHDTAIITSIPPVPVPSFVDGGNMLLVPPGDSTALAAAIRQLRDSPALRQALRQGATQLKHQFNWPAIAQDTAAFFQRVIEERR
jgi:glycosyltransferase involved in cell wall biosynthesis